MARTPSPLSLKIQKRILAGKTNKAIAKEFNCSYSKVAALRHKLNKQAAARGEAEAWNRKLNTTKTQRMQSTPKPQQPIYVEETKPSSMTLWQRVKSFFVGASNEH